LLDDISFPAVVGDGISEYSQITIRGEIYDSYGAMATSTDQIITMKNIDQTSAEQTALTIIGNWF